jgi:lysophospholipase
MSYTSSALSFMLEDLGKTVIITGAQIPLSQLRNDAVENLMGALTIAGHLIIPGELHFLVSSLIYSEQLPECCLYFNHTLFRGNRASKTSSYDLSAFSSPNFPSLVDGVCKLQPGLLSQTEAAADSRNKHRGELEQCHTSNEPQTVFCP